MNLKADFYRLIVLAVFLIYGVCPAMAQESKKFKVLVVFSYDETYPWVGEIREGIESVLKETAEIRYAYLDTKRNFDKGAEKAKEAYAIYQEFKPDGVIVADDDAQAMFVVPYLKDKVKTPVMFNGVNAKPEKYGYPASNVSGVLERYHISQSISLAQQIVPSIKTVAYIAKDGPLAQAISDQVKKESDTYSAKFIAFKMPKTVKEAVEMSKELSRQCDLLYIAALQGLPDENGTPLTDKKIVLMVVKAFGKPTIGATTSGLKDGALCVMDHTGQEQGKVASEMLLKAMTGTPVSQIPITRNLNGKRMINVTTLKSLGITPKPDVLTKTELVKTEE